VRLGDEEDGVGARVGPEREERFRAIEHVEDRFGAVVIRCPIHHEDRARGGGARGEHELSGYGGPR